MSSRSNLAGAEDLGFRNSKSADGRPPKGVLPRPKSTVAPVRVFGHLQKTPDQRPAEISAALGTPLEDVLVALDQLRGAGMVERSERAGAWRPLPSARPGTAMTATDPVRDPPDHLTEEQPMNAPAPTMRERLRAHLAEHPWSTSKAIADAMPGVDRNAVSAMLGRMLESGEIVRSETFARGSGGYRYALAGSVVAAPAASAAPPEAPAGAPHPWVEPMETPAPAAERAASLPGGYGSPDDEVDVDAHADAAADDLREREDREFAVESRREAAAVEALALLDELAQEGESTFDTVKRLAHAAGSLALHRRDCGRVLGIEDDGGESAPTLPQIATALETRTTMLQRVIQVMPEPASGDDDVADGVVRLVERERYLSGELRAVAEAVGLGGAARTRSEGDLVRRVQAVVRERDEALGHRAQLLISLDDVRDVLRERNVGVAGSVADAVRGLLDDLDDDIVPGALSEREKRIGARMLDQIDEDAGEADSVAVGVLRELLGFAS